MNALLLASLIATRTGVIQETTQPTSTSVMGTVAFDRYGVPKAKSFYEVGIAQASQRLWQMELSRRVARGRMSEIRGSSTIESDKQVLQTAYTDAELLAQVESLSPEHYQEWVDYVRGVNDTIQERKQKNILPVEYKDLGFEPEAWTLEDSAAIAVRLGNYFGGGGGGELRNMALTEILKNTPAKDRILDVMDDLAFQDHASSPCTVEKEDDLIKTGALNFYRATRAESQNHYNALPKVSIFELLPAIGLAEKAATTKVAQAENVFYKTGSYAMVVHKSRSTSGHSLLLGAPQMGMTMPAPAYEMAINTPNIQFAGMGIPGIPTPTIGSAPNFSWTLTTGAADCRDIFYSTIDGDKYIYDGKSYDFETYKSEIKVKGMAEPIVVVQRRTRFGPVILESKSAKVVFSQKTSFWNQELRAFDAIRSVLVAKTADDVFSCTQRVSLCFNFFFAMKNGDIGYRYCGYIPQRKPGYDPRLPLPGTAKAEWSRMIPPDQMPWVYNPKAGLITNWNNKPVRWWPNLDTPAFGMVNHVQEIRNSLPSGLLGLSDLENANQTIGRRTGEGSYLTGLFKSTVKLSQLPEADLCRDFDGTNVDGSIGVTIFRLWKDQLVLELFRPSIGTLGGEANLKTIAQPSVIVAALQGKTKIAYLTGTVEALSQKCLASAISTATNSFGPVGDKWRWRANGIKFGALDPIPFGNRGTYIQIIEEAPVRFGRNVLLPGNAETGEHETDQVVLGRSWEFKPMWFLASPNTEPGSIPATNILP